MAFKATTPNPKIDETLKTYTSKNYIVSRKAQVFTMLTSD